jgi:hypothetical protein
MKMKCREEQKFSGRKQGGEGERIFLSLSRGFNVTGVDLSVNWVFEVVRRDVFFQGEK